MSDLDLKPSEYRAYDQKRHFWRRSPALKPIVEQPRTPWGNPEYAQPRFKGFAVLLGLWAAGVIIWAHTVGGQDPWVVGPLSVGPGLLYLFILLLNDR